jgi:hypothetical protein
VLAAALLLSTPPELADVVRESPETAAMTEMFIAACLDGKLSLSRDSAEEVKPRNVPFWVREDDERGKAIHYYKLREPTKAYLVTASYDPPTADGMVSDCYIAAAVVDAKVAGMLVHHAITGTVPHYVKYSHNYTNFIPDQHFYVSITPYSISGTRFSESVSRRLYEKLSRNRRHGSSRPKPIGN